MDWLSPVNAGAPSALVLKEGDRVFCRYCDKAAVEIKSTMHSGQYGWPEEILVLSPAQFDPQYNLRCYQCKEVVMCSDVTMPDAPLEMRPKD